MTTTPRKKRYLSGFRADGSIVKIRTAAEYSYLVAHSDGHLTRHFHADTARKSARSGDTIIGLSTGGLRPSDFRIVIKRGDLILTYPRCYACDNPGMGFAARWVQGSHCVGTQPACVTRHALKAVA